MAARLLDPDFNPDAPLAVAPTTPAPEADDEELL
jgi:hypothetical protein